MSLRLPEDQAAELAAMSMVYELSVSEFVREAIADHLERLRSDKDFVARLQRAVQRNEEALRILAES